MANKNSLIRVYFLSLLALSTVPVAILGYLWVAKEYDTFTQQMANMRDAFVQSKQELLRREVDKAIEYMDYRRAQINSDLYKELRQQVATAVTLVRNIHLDRGADESQEALLLRIRQNVDVLRFNEGKGFFFVLGSDGRVILPPTHPLTGARLDTETMASLVNNLQQNKNNPAYIQYSYSDPEAGIEPRRNNSVAFYYAPLNIYVLASTYLDDAVARVKAEVVDRLGAIPFDPNSSVLFVTDYEGVQKVNPYNPKLIGQTLVDVTQFLSDAEDVAAGDFREIAWQQLGSEQAVAANSYMRAYEEWGFVVGAGFFLDELDALLAKEREALEQRVFGHIRFIVLVAVGLLLSVVLVAGYMARRSERGFKLFQQFFNEASKKSINIDVAQLPFSEFEELAIDANYMVDTRSNTERALQVSERRLTLALDAAKNYVWELDLRNENLRVDAEFFASLGFSGAQREQSVGNFIDLCHPEDRASVAAAFLNWRRAVPGNSVDFRVRDKQAGDVWIQLRGDIVELGDNKKPLRAMGIMTDISDRKRLESELVAARIAADDANHAKSQFLSSVSHELRTPLNGVLGYTQLMLRESEVSEQAQSHLNAIDSCGTHLLNLINDVLDLAKVESGNMEIDAHPASLPSLIRSVGDIVRQRALNKGLRYELEYEDGLPEFVQVDEVRLRQVLVNLLDNAVKFTEQGHVSLSLRRGDAPGSIYFSVRDTGIGIPEGRMAEVLEPFKQVNQFQGMGTGLGLSICTRLIEAMGGELGLESDYGHGSHFYFELPVPEAASPEHIASETALGSHAAALIAKLSVLVVDDVVGCDLLSKMLGEHCALLSHAHNFETALQLAKKTRFDLVIFDVVAVGDPQQFMGVIPALHEGNKPAFIVLSAADEAELYETTALRTRTLFKPLAHNALLSAIEGLATNVEKPQERGLPIQALDDELLSDLLNVLSLGDVAGLRQLIQDLLSRGEVKVEFADEVVRMLEDFDLERLHMLLLSCAGAEVEHG